MLRMAAAPAAIGVQGAHVTAGDMGRVQGRDGVDVEAVRGAIIAARGVTAAAIDFYVEPKPRVTAASRASS
jgi:hypothetical protein